MFNPDFALYGHSLTTCAYHYLVHCDNFGSMIIICPRSNCLAFDLSSIINHWYSLFTLNGSWLILEEWWNGIMLCLTSSVAVVVDLIVLAFPTTVVPKKVLVVPHVRVPNSYTHPSVFAILA